MLEWKKLFLVISSSMYIIYIFWVCRYGVINFRTYPLTIFFLKIFFFLEKNVFNEF